MTAAVDGKAAAPAGARPALVGLVILVGGAASAFRLVLAPGFELYAGPFVYLLCYRAAGVRLGVIGAVATMLWSILWWGHMLSVVLAVGQVLFLHGMRGRTRSLAIGTLVYEVTIASLAGFIFLKAEYQVSGEIIAVVILRKLLNDVLMAALVDLLEALLHLDFRTFTLNRRRTISLSAILPPVVTLIVVASALVLFIANAVRFPHNYAKYSAEMELRAELGLRHAMDAQAGIAPGLHALSDGTRFYVVPQGAHADLRRPEVLKTLGCRRLDDGSKVTGPNDRNTFVFLVTSCRLETARVRGQSFAYAYPTRGLAELVYSSVLFEMIGPGIILGMAMLLVLFLNRAMIRSLLAWHDVVKAFGRPDLKAPTGLLFSEFARPIDAIVSANNRFAAVVEERKCLAKAFLELKREVDLKLAADIRFDGATGELFFDELSLERPVESRTITIHANDRIAFAGILGSDEAFVEFRTTGPNSQEWFLLSVRERTQAGQWRSGWIVRLRQSKLARNRMLQQARLVELGGMASAISHELKQPLFTISLSSENGKLLIDQGSEDSVARARSKFDRITEQVNRSRDIIQRISRYSRIEDDDLEPVEIGDVVNAALAFMRPLLVEKNVDGHIDLPSIPIRILASRVGLEQILVNLIQNSADAIASRRELEPGTPGRIEVKVAPTDDGLRIQIADNGSGLDVEHADTVFDAFVTTKEADHGTGLGLYISRQILMEIGGRIAIASREPPLSGAVVTIDLPACVVLREYRARPCLEERPA